MLSPIFYLGNSVVTLNLSSDWFPHKKRAGSPHSAQGLIFETISRFEFLVDLIYNNNSIKGMTGPSTFYSSLAKCGQNLQFMRVKSCTYSHGPFERAFRECFSQLKNLRILNLSYSNLNDVLVSAMAECMGEIPNLQKINLK